MASPTVQSLLAAFALSRAEALLLLAHASGLRRERLIAASDESLDPLVEAHFRELGARRVAGEPIAYLLGAREFYGRRFAVDRGVLIPRPETELLVDEALRWIDAAPRGHDRLRLLDLGTGSGAIAISVALERPDVDVVATDRSDAALAVAQANAAALGARVRFAAGDWFDALAATEAPRFDAIVANPPYVAVDDRHLDDGDLRFEPRDALTDHADGLEALRRIVAGAPVHLRSGGVLMVEHGHDQASAVRALMIAAGLVAVRSVADLAGIPRVTIGAACGA